jgi:hypothetical protein
MLYQAPLDEVSAVEPLQRGQPELSAAGLASDPSGILDTEA